jgi:hypothetical protein
MLAAFCDCSFLLEDLFYSCIMLSASFVNPHPPQDVLNMFLFIPCLLVPYPSNWEGMPLPLPPQTFPLMSGQGSPC